MSDLSFIHHAKNLLSLGRVEDCLTLLKDNVKDPKLQNEIILITNRWHTLEEDVRGGLINHADARLEENRINNAILLIVDRIPIINEAVNLGKETKERTSFPMNKTLPILGIIGALLLVGGLLSKNIFFPSPKPDPCQSVYCKNGQCKEGKCECEEGYRGKACEISIAEEKFKELFSEGNKLYQEKQYAMAKEKYKEALKINPYSADASKAVEDCEKAMGPASGSACATVICPANKKCKEGKCVCYDGYKGTDCEISVVEEKFKELFSEGNKLYQEKQYKMARDKYQEALKINPFSTDARRAVEDCEKAMEAARVSACATVTCPPNKKCDDGKCVCMPQRCAPGQLQNASTCNCENSKIILSPTVITNLTRTSIYTKSTITAIQKNLQK